MRTAVANREIETPIGSDNQPVEVVPRETKANPKPAQELCPLFGTAIRIHPLELPKTGDIGQIHTSIVSEHPSGHAIEDGMKTLRVNR